MSFGRHLPRDPEPGAQIDAYRLLAVVGRGASGRVYRARDGQGEAVALKLLETLLAGDATARRRFEHEIRAAREVAHPNVVPILAAGEFEGRPFLVMPWYPNGSLADELAFAGPLAAERLATVALDVGAGLDALHDDGLVHRDIKTANVLVASDGHLALSDLGLVRGPSFTRLTRPGEVVGTADFVAPELILGAEATVRSDVYAFACVLFECITGQPPFSGRRALEVARAHLEAPPPDPLATRGDLPAGVRDVIAAGLSKEPAGRPRKAGELGRRLAAALGHGTA